MRRRVIQLGTNRSTSPSALPGDGADLYAAVQAVGMELCPALGITIPVGKDSMSMKTLPSSTLTGYVRRSTVTGVRWAAPLV